MMPLPRMYVDNAWSVPSHVPVIDVMCKWTRFPLVLAYSCDGCVQWSRKLFVKPEFEVAKRMVGLLYFQVRQGEPFLVMPRQCREIQLRWLATEDCSMGNTPGHKTEYACPALWSVFDAMVDGTGLKQDSGTNRRGSSACLKDRSFGESRPAAMSLRSNTLTKSGAASMAVRGWSCHTKICRSLFKAAQACVGGVLFRARIQPVMLGHVVIGSPVLSTITLRQPRFASSRGAFAPCVMAR